MAQLHITPGRVAPYVISGAAGAHILARMRYLSRQPAIDIPLYFFLLKNTDVIIALGGASVVMWQLAKHKPHQQRLGGMPISLSNRSPASTPDTSVVAGVVHQLRQIFTALLLGLGLVKRQAQAGQVQRIPGLVRRLDRVVRQGIDAVDLLELSSSTNGREQEYGA